MLGCGQVQTVCRRAAFFIFLSREQQRERLLGMRKCNKSTGVYKYSFSIPCWEEKYAAGVRRVRFLLEAVKNIMKTNANIMVWVFSASCLRKQRQNIWEHIPHPSILGRQTARGRPRIDRIALADSRRQDGASTVNAFQPRTCGFITQGHRGSNLH